MKASLGLILVCVAGLLLAGCAPAATPAPTALPPTAIPTAAIPPPATPAPTALPPTAAPTAESSLLELCGVDGACQSLTLSDLQALPISEGQAGTKSSAGVITPPTIYSGVSLSDLAQVVGGLSSEVGVNVVAKDGYIMTLSTDQINQGQFITYDPATGDERAMQEPLTVILAYARDGEPIPSEAEGPLRLAILSPKNNQVTDGHWSVKWVRKVELIPLGKEWKLGLSGVIEDELDRNSIQSCSAPGCHQSEWIDDQGQKWMGTPLFYMAGRVDDAIKHDGPAFFDLLATLGYDVQLVASDGFSTTLEISRLAHNRDILLAYQVDGAPLPEKYYPMRLVGPGLDKKEMIGGVTHINLLIDPDKLKQALELMPQNMGTPVDEPAATPLPELTAEPPAANAQGDLMISGLVDLPQAFSDAALHDFPSTLLQAEHPKTGMGIYNGIRLLDLLKLAAPRAEAATLVIIAADGYQVEAPLADVLACRDCLVTFTGAPGVYNLVMPGLPSSLWVKNVTTLEVK